MSERVVKYLKALSRRNAPLSLKAVENLSSDFDVSQKDLEKLSKNAQIYLESGSLLLDSQEELYKELRKIIFSAYHDKELLVSFIPVLAERYRKDKMKLVFDMLCLSCAQAKRLGASEQDLGIYASLALDRRKRQVFTYQLLALLLAVVCLFFFYKPAFRGWFNWFISPFTQLSQPHQYLGKKGVFPYEEPLGSSKSLPLEVSLEANLPALPLKVERAFIDLFPEAYLYDVRAAISLLNDWQSFSYQLIVKDINKKELEIFTGQKKFTSPAMGKEGVTLPIELQYLQLGKPKGTPHSLSLHITEVHHTPSLLEPEKREPLVVINQANSEAPIECSLLEPVWKENFGLWRGQFVLEIKQQNTTKLKELRVRFSLLDEQGKGLDSFETSLLKKETSLPLSNTQKRRFFIEHDFLKTLVANPFKDVKTYQLEVLSWQ